MTFPSIVCHSIAAVVLCSLQPWGHFRLRADEESGAKRGAAADTVSYKIEIAPLLEAHCIRCHGDQIRKADLNLATAEGILKGGESGPVLVPGAPDRSALYEKIHSGEMPPAGADGLSSEQRVTIERWILQGGPPAGHGNIPGT